jgi:hypothetical protein
LLVQPALRLAEVAVRGPGVSGGARDLVAAEVPCGDAAMSGGLLELRSRLLAEPRRSLEPLACSVATAA